MQNAQKSNTVGVFYVYYCERRYLNGIMKPYYEKEKLRMKGKRLALLLAAALTVNSMAGAASTVSGADFTSEIADEAEVEVSQSEADEEIPVPDEDSADIDVIPETEQFSEETEVSVEEGEAEEYTESESEQEQFTDNVGDSKSVIPDDTTALILDKDYPVVLNTLEEEVWFLFTPTEDGRYGFSSEIVVNSKVNDPEVLFYDKKVDNKDLYKSRDYDGKCDGCFNFQLNSTLKAGITYYYCVQLSNVYVKKADSFPVRISKIPDFQSVGAIDMTTEVLEGDHVGYGLEATFVYSDGSSKVVSNGSYNDASDEYENRLYYVYRKDGQEYIKDQYEAGNYTAQLKNDSYTSKEFAFTVLPIEQSKEYLGIVKNGKNVIKSVKTDPFGSVSFVPSESGKYQLKGEGSVSVHHLKTKINGKYTEVQGKSDIYELTAGQKYYIYIFGNESGGTLVITKSAVVQKISLNDTGVKKKSFFAMLDSCYLLGGKITVSYSNGEKCELELNCGDYTYDTKGNSFSYYYKNIENDKKYSKSAMLESGIYQVIITCNDTEDYETSCKIQVRSHETIRQLKEGNNSDIERTEEYLAYTWYKFVPEVTGDYEFSKVSTDIRVKKYNMEDESVDEYISWVDGSDDGEGYSPIYSMEKGFVYYIGLSGGSKLGSILKIVQKNVVSVKLTTKQKEHILRMPSRDGTCYGEEIAVLNIQYSDGSSGGWGIDENNWGAKIRNFKVKIVNADTGEVVDNYYDMEEGNYKLSCTDGNITTNEVEIHAITADSLQKLEIDKKQSIKGGQYYVIEPKETAEYVFECREFYDDKDHIVDLYGDKAINVNEIDSETGKRYMNILDVKDKKRVLYAGKKYLIWCSELGYFSPSDAYPGTVWIKPYDEIKSFEVLSYSPEVPTAVANIDTVEDITLDSLKARLQYKSGRTRDLDIAGDQYEGQFHYEVMYKDKSGKYYSLEDIDQKLDKNKTYVIRACFGWPPSLYADNVEIKVKFVDPPELKGSSIKLSASAKKWTYVKYTPTFSGTYKISAVGGTVDQFVYYDDVENDIGRRVLTTIENGKCNLTRNQTCYFRVYADEANPEFTVLNDECQWLEQSRKEPTCTEEGSITSLCKLHGEQKTEKTEALGHEMGEWIISKNATCTENGEKFQKCIRCDLKNTEIIETTGHAWGQWQTVQNATCTSDGIERRICSVCKKTESQTVEATGHAWGEEQTQEAGEDTSGKVYRVCGNCQEEEILKVLPAQKITQTVQNVNTAMDDIKEEAVTEEQKKTVEEAVKQITELDNTELLHSEDAIDTITKVENILVRSENQIGETQVEKAESFGNVEAVGAALTAAKEAEDMEETPKVAAKLSVTESPKDYGHIEKDALAMNITLSLINTETKETVEGKEEIQPKAPIQITMEIPENLKGRNLTLLHMKEDGAQENINYQMDKANEKISFSVASLSDYVIVPGTCTGEHTMDESGWTETLRTTCTTEGKMVNKCTVCGYEQVKILPLEEHNFSVKTAEGKKPTCTEDGYELYKCQNCEETVSQVLSATGHEMTKVSEKEASCTVDGEITYRCQHEGCSETRTETVPRTAHTWEEKVTQKATCAKTGKKILKCTKCSEEITVVTPYGNDHKFVWKTIKPTYKEKGRKYKECQKCKLVTKTEILEKEKPVLSMNVQANKTILLKLKQTFNAKVTRMANGDKVSSWKSSNTKVATITSNGKITARKSGTTTITVKLKSGITSSFKVKVQKTNVAATSITVLNKDTKKKITGIVTLKLKKKLALAVSLAPLTCKQKVTFISSDKKIASVTSKGVITARKKGTVTITVKAGKKAIRFKIKVK